MNPAQFQNMGAMGGGMPNNMQPQMRSVGNITPQQIQRVILQSLTQHTQSLQAQGKFSGWHSSVQIEQRAGQVKLLIDSLRLIQPVVAYDQAINVALTFEQKAFSQEPTREKYLATIKEKLSRIQDTRASQVQNQSNNLQQMMQPSQNMPFNPQMQQSMQPSPMMPQGIPQGQQNLGQGMMGQQRFGGQNIQQRMNIPNQNNFSADDNKHINELAAEMAKRTSNAKMQEIREGLTDQQMQQMAAKNVDPLAFYFRAQATKEFSRRKLAAQVQNAQRSQQQGQTFDNQASNPLFPVGIDRFQGQQADGLRSQEVGELVVPVSNRQGMNAEQFQLHKQMVQNQQRQANGGTNPAVTQQNQQNQLNRQVQAQAQARAQQTVSRAQLGQSQGPSQSTTPLSQVNRPGPGVQGPNVQGINRLPSRPPQQPQPGVLGQGQQLFGQGIADPLARFPPALQVILRQKPQNEWKATAQAWMSQQASMRRSASQQPLQPGQIQQLPNGQFLGGPTIGAPPMQPSLSTGAMPTQGQPPRSQPENAQQMLQQQQQQQRQMQQNQEVARQRQLQLNQIQQQQLQNHQQQAQIQQQIQQHQQPKPGHPNLTPGQMNYMDQQDAHHTIAENLQQHQQWSPAVKTWGQLKQWLQRNPIATLPLTRIEEVQKVQFWNMIEVRRKQQQQLQQQQNGGLPTGQNGISPQQLTQAQHRPGMPPQTAPGPMNNMTPQIRPIGPEEIARARQMNPQFQTVSDDQIRAYMFAQRAKMMQNRLNEQNQAQQAVFMPLQTGPQQPQPPSQMVRQPSASGSRPGLQHQMSQTTPRQQPTRPPQAQPQGGAQMAGKNLKRPNEIDNAQPPQTIRPESRPQQQPPAGGVPNISKEQFEKMPPHQQQRYMQMKRLEARNREAYNAIIQLTKEVQSTMPTRKGIANMSAANKARATKQLTQEQTKNMLGRFDQFIVQFLSLSNDREAVKQMLAQRLQLMPQYKAQSVMNRTWEVADQFSMTADQIEYAITDMFQKFQMTLQKSAQIRQASQNIQAQGPPAPQQLTPGNLELLEQQEAQRRNSKTAKGKDVPPAPTTSQSPFTFGDSRGQGTPKYGNIGLKQEDLKLDLKKRKRNPNAPATPATPATPVNPIAAGLKAESGKITEQVLPFKCSDGGCEYQIKGFATQHELDSHVREAHRPAEEPVDDPVTFFIDNMHIGLGLDEDGRPAQQRLDALRPRSVAMQKTASTASAAVKSENMSSSGTPAARNAHDELARPVTAESNVWADAKVKPEFLHNVFSGPDPFSMEFDLDEFVRVYKESDHWKSLPPADPQGGFCADWKEPEELREEREKKLEAKAARLTGGEAKSLVEGVDNDLLVDLRLDDLDLDNGDAEWETIDNMGIDMDFDVDMGSPWENIPSAEVPSSPIEQVMTADDFLNVPWEDLAMGDPGWNEQHVDDDAASHDVYPNLDWEAMFVDADNIMPGTNGMQAKRTIVKRNAATGQT